MKLHTTKRITDKLKAITYARQTANTVNALLTTSMVESAVVPTEEGVRQLRDAAAKLKENSNTSLSEESLMMMLLIEKILSPVFKQDDPALGPIMPLICSESRIFDPLEAAKNSYISNIEFEDQQCDDFKLEYRKFAPFELSMYNSPFRVKDYCFDIPRICCFNDEFKFPAISRKSTKSVWMSITPNEIVTMSPSIKKAAGKVLTLGCGMGYYAYMTSLKDEVESVDIVENDEAVIDMFRTYILPQFENKDKINIIRADAVEFLKNITDGEYDHCFADIWTGIQDIEPYFAVKEASRGLKKTRMDFWIEESFASYFSNFVYMEIMDAYRRDNNLEVDKEKKLFKHEYERKVLNYIHRLLNDVEITKPEEIEYYMNPQNIIKLIGKKNITYFK